MDSLGLPTISDAELCDGVAILPPGRRRGPLLLETEAILRDAFEDRALPFDCDALRVHGHRAAEHRSVARPDAVSDRQIPVSRGLAAVPHDVRDFADSGIGIVDPWSGA